MEILNNIRKFITANNLDCVLVNSTNEFLEEYTPLSENARYILTEFSGSTGDAVVTADNVYLFVDGRYHIQADMEVNHNIITVIKLQTGDSMLSAMQKLLPTNAKIGVCSKKNSQNSVEKLSEYFKIQLFDNDLIPLQKEKTKDNAEPLNIAFTGRPTSDKLRQITRNLNPDDAILVTNAEEVSYLFNVRDFSRPYTAKIKAKAIIGKKLSAIYKDMEKFEQDLKLIKGQIFVDKSSISAYDYKLAGSRIAVLKQSPVQKMKSVKNEAEIFNYIKSFERTDMAVSAIRDYIEKNDNISEYAIAEKLEEYFKHFGAKSLSFKSIVAKDKNSALAHYSKCSKDEIVKDGSLVLIDCGAYYEGGLATDITRVFVKGTPSDLQKRVYTTVLKVFLNCYNFKVDENTTGYDIDNLAREIFAKNQIEGFEFNHGLGHGIGISVHEYPPNLSPNELAKVNIEDNMCFTIEPGLYNKEHFGVRLENSCYMKNRKIKSFVKMNFEKKLIDFNMLTEQEKEWLKEFEVK